MIGLNSRLFNMKRMVRGLLVMCVWAIVSSSTLAVEPPSEDALRAAIERGLAPLKRAGPHWRSNTTCFSCHHQTLPMFAMLEAARAGFPLDTELIEAEADFTRQDFQKLIPRMLSGDHIAGGSYTAGYGLWALNLANRPGDDTTAAAVTYLLKTQGVVRLKERDPRRLARDKHDGRWMVSCRRAPLQISELGATVLALQGIERFAAEELSSQVALARQEAETYLATAPLETSEDRMWRLWGLRYLDGESRAVDAARAAILADQRADAGWGQSADRASDAYATGQSIFILLETAQGAREPAVDRGLRYLLSTQHEDGSWLVVSHARPFQPYFDNGDPHGVNQFISTAASAWATAALARALPRPCSSELPN